MPDLSATTLQAMAFLVGVLVTALVTAAINRWYKRPRPTLDVMSIRIGPGTGAEELTVSIDYAMFTRIHDSPILPSLDDRVTVKALGDWIDSAESAVAGNRKVMAHLASMLARPTLLEPGLAKDRQREAILNEWSRFGRPLEALATGAVRHFASETPELYEKPHPDEWRDPQRAHVHLEGTRDYNLREIDVEEELAKEAAVQGPVGLVDGLRAHMHALNIVRRIWIHLEEADVRWFLAKVSSLGSAFEQDATELIASARQLVVRQNPDFLRVDLLVRNDGERAFSVNPEAYLTLRLRQDGQATQWAVPMAVEGTGASSPGVARTIAGNSAASLAFYSASPIDSLRIVSPSGEESTMDAGKLRALYDQEILPCRFGIALGGLRGRSDRTCVSQEHSFGAGATRASQDHLRRAISAEMAGT